MIYYAINGNMEVGLGTEHDFMGSVAGSQMADPNLKMITWSSAWGTVHAFLFSPPVLHLQTGNKSQNGDSSALVIPSLSSVNVHNAHSQDKLLPLSRCPTPMREETHSVLTPTQLLQVHFCAIACPTCWTMVPCLSTAMH